MIRDYILIIGAMKSGTTTLYDLLAAHPAIVGARVKEPGFFAFEDSWAEGFSYYEGLFTMTRRCTATRWTGARTTPSDLL